MIVAVSATVMAVLKKVLAFLLGDKKGRKILGYTIGIVLFIALLPVIAVYGLFGWMSGNDAAGIIGYDAVYEKLPTEQSVHSNDRKQSDKQDNSNRVSEEFPPLFISKQKGEYLFQYRHYGCADCDNHPLSFLLT